jgi:DNA topoisomerase I
VTLNLDPEAPVPKLPRGRHWGGVVWQPGSEWLWSWVDPLLNKTKYVYPAAVSSSHAEKEREKFDNARELENHIDKIRKFYKQSLKTGEYEELACILYLIDNLGLRIGNENNDKVDGATTLKVENVKPMNDRNLVRINFIGKDSIEYDNQLSCSEEFIKTIRRLSTGKSPSEPLFPNVNPKTVNQYLQSFHPCLTAKTFRTYNATQRFKDAIYRYRSKEVISGRNYSEDFVAWFKKCATEVAVFCNHKKISTLKKVKEQYSPTTSITNYIDPRVVVEWANTVGVPVRKLYSKTLLERFSWAIQKEEEEDESTE